jgi:hypothetical protein
MSCCGRSRVTASTVGTTTSRQPASPSSAHVRKTVSFVYEGPTRLNAQGPITRRIYRFEHPGSVVDVDVRDAASMAAIPNLRRPRPT